MTITDVKFAVWAPIICIGSNKLHVPLTFKFAFGFVFVPPANVGPFKAHRHFAVRTRDVIKPLIAGEEFAPDFTVRRRRGRSFDSERVGERLGALLGILEGTGFFVPFELELVDFIQEK